jgi:hypothetical protein
MEFGATTENAQFRKGAGADSEISGSFGTAKLSVLGRVHALPLAMRLATARNAREWITRQVKSAGYSPEQAGNPAAKSGCIGR